MSTSKRHAGRARHKPTEADILSMMAHICAVTECDLVKLIPARQQDVRDLVEDLCVAQKLNA